MALNALYGVKTGIDLSKLTPLARLAEEIVGYEIAWNHPVTGREVFNWGGTEFVIQELKVDPLIHWCIEPSMVGNERRWDVTFDSGPYTMLDKLEALGLEVDAGPALVIAALGSWFGGTVSVLGLMLFAPPLAELMLTVGPSATFSLMVLALIVMSFVSSGSTLKTFMMIVVGLILGTVGLDGLTAHPRFTFGSLHFVDGISFVAMALGLFGVSEILINLENVASIRPMRPTLRSLVPTAKDLRDSAPAIGRGTIIGFLMGIVPGISHVVSTFVSYAVEKKLSKEPEAFGTGKIEGVAGPETANNATTGSAMIPLLVLGIPAIPATAILLSALMIHGIEPGPQLINDHPDVFWGLIASMYIGNVILVILNVPLVGVFVSLLRTPYAYLGPMILLVSIVGVYTVNASSMEIWLMTIFGAIGYVLRKLGFDVAPLLLAVVLGDRMELAFRRSLTISNGDFSIFVDSATSKVLLGAVIVVVAVQGIAWYLGWRGRSVRPDD